MLLKVALSTIKQTNKQTNKQTSHDIDLQRHMSWSFLCSVGEDES
jgi:hypothetical protein